MPADARDAFTEALRHAQSLSARADVSWDARLEAWEAALALGEEGDADARTLALAWLEAGALCMEGHETTAAVEAFSHAVAHAPDLAEAHANLSGAHTALGDLDAALDAARRALALQPTHPGFLELTARALRRLHRDDEAAEVYARWYAVAPDDPTAAHHGRSGDGPARATAAYVRDEFDRFAATFDEVLRARLAYRAPERIAATVDALFGDGATALHIADLGCGTGLCGPLLRPRAARLVGVDLSPEMLRRATDRGYDALIESDLVTWCTGTRETFDLLVAADVLNYFGDLVEPLRAASRCLRDGGAIVFTVEHDDRDAPSSRWELRVDGRYRHAPAYLDDAVADAGLTRVRREHIVIRTEHHAPVHGWIVTARATPRP